MCASIWRSLPLRELGPARITGARDRAFLQRGFWVASHLSLALEVQSASSD